MKKNAGQQEKREERNGGAGAARENQKKGLYLAMQKPLEQNQRQEGQDEPKEAGKEHNGNRRRRKTKTAGCVYYRPPSVILYLFYSGLNNGCKIVRLQARAADQRAVNLGLTEKLGGICGGNRAAIQDADCLRRFRAE